VLKYSVQEEQTVFPEHHLHSTNQNGRIQITYEIASNRTEVTLLAYFNQ